MIVANPADGLRLGKRNCLRLDCQEVWTTGPLCREKTFVDGNLFVDVASADGVNMVEQSRDTNSLPGFCKQKWTGSLHRTYKDKWECKHPKDECALTWDYNSDNFGKYTIEAKHCKMPFNHGVIC